MKLNTCGLHLVSIHLMFLTLAGCNLFAEDVSRGREENLSRIKLPPGFAIEIYADNVDGARSLTLGTDGTIFVGTRREGKVYAVVDKDGDYKVDKVYTIASGMNQPNGVAFRDNALYVAEIDKIWKFEKIETQLSSPPKPVLIYGKYPKDEHHGWKFIAFGPDGKLYIPVGAPCNICLSKEKIYAAITRMNPDGSGMEVFAHGIRNTVGFDWHPDDNSLWFTDNGRDWLGDNQPPDELNRAPESGLHFGYPYCHGKNIPDPEFGELRACSDITAPQVELGPHVAALGMRFYSGKMFPEGYQKDILIAEHGSWNRTDPIGYRVMKVKLDGSKVVSYEVFAEGWLQNGKAWGRPVDLLVLPDGSLLVSDDAAGVIYRIYYQN